MSRCFDEVDADVPWPSTTDRALFASHAYRNQCGHHPQLGDTWGWCAECNGLRDPPEHEPAPPDWSRRAVPV